MATTQNEEVASFIATVDMSGSQFRGVKLDTANPGQVTLPAALGARCDGICMNKPIAGQVAEVVTDGQTKAMAGAAVASAGLELTLDATNRVIAAVTGNTVFAFSLGPATGAGEVIPIMMDGPYVKP